MKAANRTQFARNMYICIHINLELQYNCLDGIHKIGNGGVARSNEAIQREKRENVKATPAHYLM